MAFRADGMPRFSKMGFSREDVPKSDAHHHSSVEPRLGEICTPTRIHGLGDGLVERIVIFGSNPVTLIPEAYDSHRNRCSADEGLVGIDP